MMVLEPEDIPLLVGMIAKMRSVNSAFYNAARSTECHSFIEFCGIQAKFIDLCQRSLENGVDFRFTNQHMDRPLTAEWHDIAYLAEKIACVFGPTLQQDDEHAQQFARAVFGRELVPLKEAASGGNVASG